MEQFEVIFLDEDEKTILDKQIVNKGEKVEYKGKMPVKEPENQIKYNFEGWIGEEKMQNVQENLTLVAKYSTETVVNSVEQALYDATLETTKETAINSTLKASEKIVNQMKMLEKDTRTAEEIVTDVLKNGKTEIAPEKNDVER